MRAIHLVGPDTRAGVQPLCGSWGSMDTDWTPVASEVTCTACAAALQRRASESARALRAAGGRAPPAERPSFSRSLRAGSRALRGLGARLGNRLVLQ